jgi:hypothetical protein
MNINHKFFEAVEPVLKELKQKIGDDSIIFGSSPLYLLGVLPFNDLKDLNDLDVAIKDVTRVPEEAKQVTFHGNPDQKLYKLIINGIEVDIGGIWPGQEDYFYKLFENPIIVGGFKFANLEICEEWKVKMIKKYNRQKDKEYLEKIRIYKSKI